MFEHAERKRRRYFAVLADACLFCTLGGCGLKSPPSVQQFSELASPAAAGSKSPRLTTLHGEIPLLSWLEPDGEKSASLRFSTLRNGDWSAPATIARQKHFATHPSETPGVLALPSGKLIAYWTQRPMDTSKYPDETDVYFSGSSDGGNQWTNPVLVSLAGTDSESSFASAAAIDSEHAVLVWLDGRDWKTKKRVSLMSRIVQADGTMSESTIVDDDTCTCCPTSTVSSRNGILTAYRDHTSADIRDIATLRYSNGHWSQPKVVHPDNWHFAGCPVNGPALDADEKHTAIAWFTGATGRPAVQVAFSRYDEGIFSEPLRVDEGNAIGRAQVVLGSADLATVFWLENQAGTARMVARSVQSDKNLGAVREIARGKGLGYPHMARVEQGILVTWTEETPLFHVRVGKLEMAVGTGDKNGLN